METYKLLRPITFEGQEITCLEYDFERVSAEDICRAEDELPLGRLPIMSSRYHAALVACASRKPIELIMALDPRDFTRICAESLAFFGALESEPEASATTDE